jgi:hypothetical protein
MRSAWAKQNAWQRFAGEMRHSITGEELEREDHCG